MQSNTETEEKGISMSSRLLGLLLLGVALVFVGIAVLAIASMVLGGAGSVGGVILIGPIPIVFGAGANSWLLVAVGIILTVVSIVLFLVMNRHSRKSMV